MDGSAANLSICLRGSFETALHHHPPWRRMTLRDFAGKRESLDKCLIQFSKLRLSSFMSQERKGPERRSEG